MVQSNIGTCRFVACVGLAFLTASAVVDARQTPVDCGEPRACSELALDARARGAYEAFHDLAWRAVQTGRPNDPDLMYLLARAQALSGRRRDALIMLRRLAESGIANDAATHEDFRRVRELADWPYVAGLATQARPVAAAVNPPKTAPSAPAIAPVPAPATARAAAPTPAAPPVAAPAPAAVAAPSAAPPKAPPPARSALRVERSSVEEAAKFSTRAFVPGGFAYDAASQRMLFGDVTGRRLFVVGEGSDRTADLVRADSAGFDDVTAVALDAKRGDLWVASSDTSGSGGAIHRLQLISGRALAKLPVPGDGPMLLSDVAVTGDGTVLILDGATPRVFVRRPGATAVALLTPLTVPGPVSIAASDDGRSAYVAHREGITHIDVSSRRAQPLDAAKGIALGGFAFIRWHRDGLIGSQFQPDGAPGFVRLRLDRDRASVREATLTGDPASGEGRAAFAAISGDDLYYVVAEGADNPPPGSPLTDVRVKRVKLRER